MFTGIIKTLGSVKGYDETSHVLSISCPLFSKRPALGASIAIDGVCLTVKHFFEEDEETVGFDLGEETRAITLLAKKPHASVVNVEFALCVGDPLDGHMVQGHVDGTARIIEINAEENNLVMRFSVAESLSRLIVTKGSIAVNGVSLTVNEVSDEWFSVCLIPHTIQHTGFKNSSVGDLVHIETDIIGRYFQKFTERLRTAN